MSLSSIKDNSPCAGTMNEVYSNCIRSYQSENEQLKEKNRSLMQKVESLSEDTKRWEEMYSDISEGQSKSFVEKFHQLQENNLQYQTKIQAQQETIQKQSNEYQNVKQEMIHLISIVNDSIQNQEQLIQELAAKKHKNKMIIQHNRLLTNKVNNLTNDLQVTANSLQYVQSELEQTTLILEESKTENKRLLIRLAETEGNLKEIQITDDHLRKSIKGFELPSLSNVNDIDHPSKFDVKSNETNLNTTKLNEKILVLQEENSNLKEKIKLYEKQFQSFQTSQTQNENAKSKQIQNLSQELNTAKNQLQDFYSKQSKIDQIKDKLKQEQLKNQELQAKLDYEHKAHLEFIKTAQQTDDKRKIDQLLTQNKELQNKILHKDEIIKQMKQENQNLSQIKIDNQELQLQLQTIQSELTRNQKENEETKKNLNIQLSKFTTLKNQYQNLLIENKNLQKQNKDLINENQQIQQKFQNLHDQNENLQNKNEELTRRLTKIQEDYNSLSLSQELTKSTSIQDEDKSFNSRTINSPNSSYQSSRSYPASPLNTQKQINSPPSPFLQSQILDLNYKNEELKKQVQGLEKEKENLLDQLQVKKSRASFVYPSSMDVHSTSQTEQDPVQDLINRHKQLEVELQKIKERMNESSKSENII